jgi:ABC-type nitrate/sulfonate/bicarbonate transport system permease component
MKKHLYTISTFLAVILLWYFASLNANPLFIPSPLEVIEDFKIFIGD